MRGLNLDQLRAFVEVVERGSFTAAAKELNLTQPAVTHQVQELERRFQVALVERFGKRAYLTQAGEKLIEHARSLLDEDLRTQVAMRQFGDRVHVREPNGLAAASVVRVFHREHGHSEWTSRARATSVMVPAGEPTRRNSAPIK